MFTRRFGESSPWSVGVEEELFVLDAGTLLPARADSLLDGTRLKGELFRSLVELTTGVCESAEEAGQELATLRAEAGYRAAKAGLALAAAGTHPLVDGEAQEVTPDEGFERFVEYAGVSARSQYCCGLHVHIGVRSPQACVAALEAVLPWLPVILALSVNSPYLAGRETGLASARAEILARLPRTGAPPPLDSFEAWERFARRLVELGLADDYTRIWWDIRPHPRFGTIEVRMPDQPTRAGVSAAFAALVQSLVASVDLAADVPALADRGIYHQNRWAALRFGARAELIHPDGSRLATVAGLTAELLERIEPAARRLGSSHLLGPLESLADNSQADDQLAFGRAEGLESLVRRLVAETG